MPADTVCRRGPPGGVHRWLQQGGLWLIGAGHDRADGGLRLPRGGGDGRSDFLVGDPEVNTAYVYSGATLGALATLTSQTGSFFGGAVTGLGDLNGDGKADFAVGAALADRVYVYVSQ